MSSQVIARSPDLAQLRAEGYEIQVHPSNHLIVQNLPYVTVNRTVAYGKLIVPIVEVADNVVGKPGNHQAYFSGEFPCDNEGKPLSVLGQNTPAEHRLGADLQAQYYFSYKSPRVEAGNYANYYDLVTAYIEEIWKYARRVDPSSTPLTGRVNDLDDEPSVFTYRDTASTRAGISAVTEKLAGHVIAIIGVGGTGSYVLDLVSKTPVKEIRLYDGDRFTQHNAFRAPGAASAENVFAVPPHNKAEYFRSMYSAMHLNIIAHPIYLEKLPEDFVAVDFTFLCVDMASSKRHLVDSLIALKKPFIDVGMGISLEANNLGGLMRTTLSTEECRVHRHGISFADVEDAYALNIQIADLNAMNAALAVVRWKKYLGFYHAAEAEFSSVYTLNFNRLDNAGCGAAN